MLNRINQLFQDSPKNLLSIYFCAGCPNLDGTADVIRALERNGVSMIEIGIPFSDPMADGIVIQNAATRALHNGMSLRLLFEQLRDIRRDVRIPLVLMGYLNPSCSSASKLLPEVRGMRHRWRHHSRPPFPRLRRELQSHRLEV